LQGAWEPGRYVEDRLVKGLIEFVKTLGPTRLAAMAAVTAALIGFFALLIMRVTAPMMVPLFTELTIEDSSAIIKDLERQAIPYEIRSDGATILVPKDRVARLRMTFAEGGLPKGGGVGYEIFDKSDTLGSTSFVQNINRLRALEGELARTIRSLDRVQVARVHLVMPDRPLFARDQAEPSAAIVLKVRGQLEAQQVRAIQHLVASAVTGLKPTRVSIVDDSGRLLANGASQDAGVGAAADERKIGFERRLRDQVEAIVSSIVGPGRARVELSADFDLNRVTETSERFDPEGRVLRSTQTKEESSGAADPSGQVSVANELPGGQANAASSRENSKKTDEITNYEVSRTTRTEVVEGGRVSRISVAVLVDGTYAKAENGDVTYQERPKEVLDRIAALVRSAIGFDQRRGDQVEVVNLRFAEAPALAVNDSGGLLALLQFSKDDIMRAVELLVMGILGLVVVLVVVRPLVRRIIEPDQSAAALVQALANRTTTGPEPAPAVTQSETGKMLEIAKISGKLQAETVKQVGELADNNASETAAIIREWLSEAAASS
jgi:flagellar M-ring protein FliF